MNRPIFTCPHCGGVLVFDDECPTKFPYEEYKDFSWAECPKCERIVNFDEIARHIFSKEYGFDMNKPVSNYSHKTNNAFNSIFKG